MTSDPAHPAIKIDEETNSIRIDLILPMLKYMELVAADVSEAVTKLMGFNEDHALEVSMALIEACINAFEHSKSEDGKVYITFHPEEDGIRIILHDRGIGFDPVTVQKQNCINPDAPFMQRRGWGLKLMETLMDEIQIHSDPCGTQITMIKRKTTSEKE